MRSPARGWLAVDNHAEPRKQHPHLVTLVVLFALLTGAYEAFFGGNADPPAQASPPVKPATAAPAISPAGWMRPVDAPIWGGFRTPDNPDHDGVDLGADRGTPVRAASAGTVVRAKCDVAAPYGCDRDGSPQIHGCGWYVDIRHAGHVYTRYCHLLRQPDVAVDQAITAGQQLGLVGSSGNSSAPHLHFEVHLGDESSSTAVDPVPFMAEHGAPLGTG
jgi:murein DD-endopeptidase MepM/ murein hydrolase activator NlpD